MKQKLKMLLLLGGVFFTVFSCKKEMSEDEDIPVKYAKVFIYDEHGEKIYLQPVDSFILVKFYEDVNKDVALELIASIQSCNSTPEISKSNRIIVSLAPNKMHEIIQLRADISVKYANLSLLSSDGVIQMPNDKLFAKIKEEYILKDVLNKLNIQYDQFQRIGSDVNTYLITLKDGESIRTANTLYESGSFIYAQPSFIRLLKDTNLRLSGYNNLRCNCFVLNSYFNKINSIR